MAVKIRLARHGAKKYPYYRIVVADGRCKRDGRFICEVGRYNPNTNPKLVKVDLEAVDEWIAKGAQPTDPVKRLIGIAREGATLEKDPANKALSKKAAAKKAAEEAAAAEAAAAAAAAAEAGEAAAEEAAE